MNTTQYRKDIIKATSKAAVKIVKRICIIYPKILEVQPNITGISTGMGSWSFNGTGIGICTEEGHKGDKLTIDDVSIQDAVINSGNNDWYDFPVNRQLIEICELLNTLVDCSELNCSTWQNGFNEKGVIFYHSETSDQNNPFSTPNKEYLMNCDYYRFLVKAKVPILFIEENN